MRKNKTKNSNPGNTLLVMRHVRSFLKDKGINPTGMKHKKMINLYAHERGLKPIGKLKKWVVSLYNSEHSGKIKIVKKTKPKVKSRVLESSFEGLEHTMAREFSNKNKRRMTSAASRFNFMFSLTGIPYVPEHAVKREDIDSFYLIDFYIPQHGIAVEIDGSHHYKADKLEQDKIRDTYLQTKAIKVVRIKNPEMFAIKTVKDLLKRLGIG